MISSGIHKLGGNWQTMQAQKDTPDYFRRRLPKNKDSNVLLEKKTKGLKLGLRLEAANKNADDE